MARFRAPKITPEERARRQQEAAAAVAAACRRTVEHRQAEARAWLLAHGLLVPGESVGQHMRRLAAWRLVLAEQTKPAYRLAPRCEAAAPADVEVLF